MKLAKKIIQAISEMGRTSSEMENKLESMNDFFESEFFLVCYSADREPVNHWIAEINAHLGRLFRYNIRKKKPNKKNMSESELYDHFYSLYTPFDAVSESLRDDLQEKYSIMVELDEEKIKKICRASAKSLTGSAFVRLKPEDYQNSNSSSK